MAEHPTNGELKIMIDNFSSQMNDKHRENTDTLREIKKDVKEIIHQTAETKGRISLLETWSVDAKKILEGNVTSVETVAIAYKTDRARIWTALAVIMILGGTVLTLSLLLLDNRIKTVVTSVLLNTNLKEVE